MRINVEWQSIKKPYAAADVNRRVVIKSPRAALHSCALFIYFSFSQISARRHMGYVASRALKYDEWLLIVCSL